MKKRFAQIKNFRVNRRLGRIGMVIAVLLVGAAGTYLLSATHAATYATASEAESGTVAGNANEITDSNASGGKAVQFGTASTGNTTCQSVAIPAYFDPTWSGSPWATSIAAAPGVGIMIANLDNGPGTTVNSNYPPVFASAKAAGIHVLGYVDTAYAADSIASVEANINAWKSLYNVTDIFFDEASANAADEPYYQTLTAYVHQQTAGSLTMINPGTVPDQSYINAADIISIFEGDYTTYESATFPAWIKNYAPSHFFNVVFNVPNSASMTQVLNKAEQDNAGYVYATDDVLPNPYDTVPSYLTAEASQAHSNCSF